MKKVMLSLLIGIFLLSFVFAQAQGQGAQISASEGTQSQVQSQVQQQIKEGNYTGEGGQKIQIKEKAQNRYQLKINGVDVDCDCNLTQEKIQNKTKLRMKLNNGRNAEIKIMPDTASETALQRLRLKVCSIENNCTIQLKEVGKGEQTKAAYEIKTQRQSKFLGLFKAKMQVQAQVNAENGEIIRVKKPWWAFLATEPEE